MNSLARLSAYGAALALIAGGGWVVGDAIGPEPDDDDGKDGTTVTTVAQIGQPAGLASAQDGYTLAPAATTLASGARQSFSFRVLGPDGKAVTKFDVEHEKRMHLIVVRRDTAGFQHVHPTMAADGTWKLPMTFPKAGSYRAFADFKPAGGSGITLGVDLAVPGSFRPAAYEPSRQAKTDDYQVRLDGALVPGRSSTVKLTISKDGRPVTDLQPYLGAYGHLVALRGGDLAYLHVHPTTTAPGPAISFAAEVPTAGRYRMFLDFRHAGKVRTAEFTVDAAGTGYVPRQPAPTPDDGDDDHGHDGGH